ALHGREMPKAGQPSIPGRLEALDPCDVARVGGVIHIQARQLIETDDPLEAPPGEQCAELPQKVTVATDVSHSLPTKKFHLDSWRPIPFPGACKDCHFMTVVRTEPGDLHTVALQTAKRKIVEQDETKIHHHVTM